MVSSVGLETSVVTDPLVLLFECTADRHVLLLNRSQAMGGKPNRDNRKYHRNTDANNRYGIQWDRSVEGFRGLPPALIARASASVQQSRFHARVRRLARNLSHQAKEWRRHGQALDENGKGDDPKADGNKCSPQRDVGSPRARASISEPANLQRKDMLMFHRDAAARCVKNEATGVIATPCPVASAIAIPWKPRLPDPSSLRWRSTL